MTASKEMILFAKAGFPHFCFCLFGNNIPLHCIQAFLNGFLCMFIPNNASSTIGDICQLDAHAAESFNQKHFVSKGFFFIFPSGQYFNLVVRIFGNDMVPVIVTILF